MWPGWSVRAGCWRAATACATLAGLQQEVAGRIRRHHQGAAGDPARFQPASAHAGRAAGQPARSHRHRRAGPVQHRRSPDRGQRHARQLLAGRKAAAGQCRGAERRSGHPRPAAAGDQRAVQNADRSFTDRVLGARATPDTGQPVNADAEVAKRSSTAKPAAPRKTAAAGLTGSRIASLARCLPDRWRRRRLRARPTRPPSARSCRQPAPANARQTGNNTFQFALAERHAGAGDPRSPRPGRHPDAVVQGRRGGRSAGHFGPGAFLRTHDVPRHQGQCRATPSPRPSPRNGGEDNAFTTHDYTAFYEQIAKDRLPLAMKLEADRLANLDLSDATCAAGARRGAGRAPHAGGQRSPGADERADGGGAASVPSLWPPGDRLGRGSAPHRPRLGAGFLRPSLRAQQCHPGDRGRCHAR